MSDCSDNWCHSISYDELVSFSFDHDLVVFLANIDEDTNCPLNVDHECTICAEDQNRYGCYCELKNGDTLVTASIFTACPAGKRNDLGENSW